MHSKITYKGYAIAIAQDLDAENPWTAWDCNPPIMAYSGSRHGHFSDYGTGLCIRDIFDLVPLSSFEAEAESVMAALDLSEDDLDCLFEFTTDTRHLRDEISDCLPGKPGTWREAIEYFDKAESLCKLAGIACLNEESNGYCQGDSTRVFLAALPAWLELTGVQPENVESALKGSLETFSAWAWGDVFGIESITRPDGSEMTEGSVWGFYGSNHEKSGLMESARGSIDYDISAQAREAIERERAACSDIITV